MSLKERMAGKTQEAGAMPDYPVVQWEPGRVVCGEVEGGKFVDLDGDRTLVLYIDDEDDGMVAAFCGATRLASHFEAWGYPEKGDLIYICCTGEDEDFGRGGNFMKLFEIAIEDSDGNPKGKPHAEGSTRKSPPPPEEPEQMKTHHSTDQDGDPVPF